MSDKEYIKNILNSVFMNQHPSDEDMDILLEYYEEIKSGLTNPLAASKYAAFLALAKFGYEREGGNIESNLEFTGGDAWEAFEEEVYSEFL